MLQRLKSIVLLAVFLLACSAAAAQDNRTTGSIKGRVRVDNGTADSVEVIARQGDREVRHVVTNRKGEFLLAGLSPGAYGLTFRKPGLTVGRLENVEVRAGKTSSLPDRLILTVDEGSIAFVRGSVFSAEGRSVEGARVEIARVGADGGAKKIDGRITNQAGIFVFRLLPEAATYRISVWAGEIGPVTKDVEVNGPARYNVALTLPPPTATK